MMAQRSPTLTWTARANATWYEVYVASTDFSAVWNIGWHDYSGLMCQNASDTCTLLASTLNGQLTDGATYNIYVRAWGPGGLSTGGIPGAEQWAQGAFTHTITPPQSRG